MIAVSDLCGGGAKLSPTGHYFHALKEYPGEMVARVRELYEAGASQVEIAEALGVTQRVIWRLMRNHGIQRRLQVKRDQRGEKNSTWRGDDAGYHAFHARVIAARGQPSQCVACERDDDGARCEWANLTGRYEDPKDYIRLCLACHRKYDAHRRQLFGGLTTLLKGGDAAC